jgi:hypothetical protein
MTHTIAQTTATRTTSTPITAMGTARAFTKDACSGTLMSVLDGAYGHPLKAEESASNPLAGGIVQQGYQCGQLWGASLAAGAQAYRTFGPGPRAEAAAMAASRRIVESFADLNNETNCLELTEMTDSDMTTVSGVLKYFVKGGPIRCGRMAVRFAPVALREIDAALAEEPAEVSSPCASCAAKLARRMGASEQHTVMAAGLAGGIGMSGGGCGALGAAIWITGLNNPDEKTGLTADGTRIGDVIDTFIKTTDHRFECAEIAGRRFAGIDDHATYLRDGGCSDLIEALANAASHDDSGDGERLVA